MRLLIVLLCWSVGAWGATFYIDPTAGTGGVGSEADPFDQWSDVTWTAGNTYLQKAGTTATDNQILVGTTGTAGNIITVGAYDTSAAVPYAKVVCGGAATTGISSLGKEYLIVQDFDVSGCSNAGIQLVSNGTRAHSHTTIRRVYVHDNTGQGAGIVTNAGTDPAAAVNILIEDCIATNNGGHGCHITTGATDPIIRRCTATGNSTTVSGWGCYISPRARTFTSGWTLVSGTIYERTMSSAEVADEVYFGGRTTAGPYELAPGTYASLGVSEWAQSGTTLRANFEESPASKNVVVVTGPSSGGVIEDSVAYEQSGAFDGIGLGCDLGATLCTIRRNRSYDNPSDGIQCNICDTPTIESNLVWNNGDSGLSIPTNQGAAVVRHNTLVNNTNEAIETRRTYTGMSITLTNNIMVGGVAAVVAETLDGTVTDDYTIYSDQTGTAYSGVTAGANSQNVDPQFVTATPATAEDFRLQASSPARYAGTYLGPMQDYGNRRFKQTPSIGAWESASGDAATRTARGAP